MPDGLLLVQAPLTPGACADGANLIDALVRTGKVSEDKAGSMAGASVGGSSSSNSSSTPAHHPHDIYARVDFSYVF